MLARRRPSRWSAHRGTTAVLGGPPRPAPAELLAVQKAGPIDAAADALLDVRIACIACADAAAAMTAAPAVAAPVVTAVGATVAAAVVVAAAAAAAVAAAAAAAAAAAVAAAAVAEVAAEVVAAAAAAEQSVRARAFVCEPPSRPLRAGAGRSAHGCPRSETRCGSEPPPVQTSTVRRSQSCCSGARSRAGHGASRQDPGEEASRLCKQLE